MSQDLQMAAHNSEVRAYLHIGFVLLWINIGSAADACVQIQIGFVPLRISVCNAEIHLSSFYVV